MSKQRAPLISHLQALRRVILISLAAVAVAFILVFYLCLDPLMSCIAHSNPFAESSS